MPGVPIEMPSDTVMVLNSTLLPPPPSTPAHASRARSPMCMLQGVTFPQVEATPICGLSKSWSRKPTARNMARAGACVSPSTTRRECRRGSMLRFTAHSLVYSSFTERAAHAVEADGPGGRHGERQQQREFSGTVMPPLEAHIGEHADGRRQAPAQSGERDVHAHVVLRAPDGGKVVVAEIPAKISTCLSRAEQDRAHPQERWRAAEHPEAHGSARQHDRPALARAIPHHVRAVEQPRPPGQENRLGD